MDVGAKGVAVSRNIKQNQILIGVCAGLNTNIHKSGTGKEANNVYQM